MASCVADGCLTVNAYRDMDEKVVMMGDGGRGPRLCATRRCVGSTCLLPSQCD